MTNSSRTGPANIGPFAPSLSKGPAVEEWFDKLTTNGIKAGCQPSQRLVLLDEIELLVGPAENGIGVQAHPLLQQRPVDSAEVDVVLQVLAVLPVG